MDASKSPQIMEMGGFLVFQSEIEKSLIQNEAEYFYGAFGSLSSLDLQ